MNDWRSKPRTGKGQFYTHIQEIQRRLSMGETSKQIHDDLISRKLVEFGYDQFIRYIRNILKPEKARPVENTQTRMQLEPPGLPRHSTAKPKHPFAVQQVSGNGDRRRNDSLHNPVPDKSRIYADE